MLFTCQIENWRDWGKVFQSTAAFTPLAQKIFPRGTGVHWPGKPYSRNQRSIPRGRIGADILLDAARREGRSGFAHLSEVRALLLSRL